MRKKYKIILCIVILILVIGLIKIVIEFGGKDHTTVMHSVNKIENELKTDTKLEMEINSIVNNLK